MSKTAFSSKCAILGELWCFYREDARKDRTWRTFFIWADVALPMSYMLWADMVNIKKGERGEKAKAFIDEAFSDLCNILNVDESKEYKTLADIFNASPNPPLEQEDEEGDDEE